MTNVTSSKLVLLFFSCSFWPMSCTDNLFARHESGKMYHLVQKTYEDLGDAVKNRLFVKVLETNDLKATTIIRNHMQ